MLCQQAKLRCENKHTVSWIDISVKKGDLIRFKNENDWWLVEEIYLPILDKKDIHHDWKVGGLA